MARARNIKPSFFTNDKLADCNHATRLLFIGLWTIADREGRLEDRPKKIKAELMPYDDLNVDLMLNTLWQMGFIVRYKHEDKSYIHILNFKKHQNPHIKEQASTIPAPDMHGASMEVATPLTESLLLIPDSLLPIDSGETIVSPKIKKIGIDDLSVDHISDWLAEKRTQGKYTHHDENFILERFKDYCKSKGKRYNDYIAAYRNAFEWDSCQPKQRKGGDPATNAFNAAQSIIARRNAAAGIGQGSE